MKTSSPGYILGFITAVSVVFGLGVSGVHYATKGMLDRNEQLHRNRVLCRAFLLEVAGGGAEAYQAAIDREIRLDTLKTPSGTVPIYTQSATGAVGFEFSGMGFWDRITGIMVLTPDLGTVVNIQFLDQKETPGLGARIEEPWFTGQFTGLEIDWEAPPGARIVIGASPKSDAKNRVDAVTGATQTSIALMRLLNAELERFGIARAGRDRG